MRTAFLPGWHFDFLCSLNDQHMAFEGEFCLKPLEGEIEEPEGQVFDVLEADLSDWGAVGEEIEEKAEASFGDLF